MPRTQIQITPADIEACCGYIRSDRAAYALRRPLPTTPGRRQQAILAAGRDALARVLIARFGIKSYGTLTKAIRAGHDGDATDFDAINRRGAEALGLLPE